MQAQPTERSEYPGDSSLGNAQRPAPTFLDRLNRWSDSTVRTTLLLPALLVVLFLSIFPLLVSLYLSFARVDFVRGGIVVKFVGFANYNKLLFGLDQQHLLGKQGTPSLFGWVILVVFVVTMLYLFVQYASSPRRRLFGLIMRVIAIVVATFLAWMMVSTLGEHGLPGTVAVTLIFVFVGVSIEYALGLGLAMLVTQELPGKRFFRIVFLLPMMITPVGVGFLVRMMTDTLKGPIAPFWNLIGLSTFSWADTGAGARAAVLLGDVWQWTPFMFIILLAAIEGTSREQIEAALVDGANRLQLFRYITLPQIMPVSTTLVLIRMIEAFKIIDLPNILTGGGPGTATESMTLQAYNLWRTTDLGASAAVAYLLLVLVTFVATVYVSSIRRRLVGSTT